MCFFNGWILSNSVCLVFDSVDLNDLHLQPLCVMFEELHFHEIVDKILKVACLCV